MGTLQQLIEKFEFEKMVLGPDQLEKLRNGLKQVQPDEIKSANDGRRFVSLLYKFRTAVERNNRLNGDNYLQLLNSLLSVGEDGVYYTEQRFLFELIQNVDDCSFSDPSSCELDVHFDWNNGQITLSYNETGFTPFNVFAITGIAEAAKNVSAQKNEIGEKGIGFKSVFGVADKVRIRSGWFSFELHKDNFTIPIISDCGDTFFPGTEMTLYVSNGKTQAIYEDIREQYCRKDALFSRNPLLFLNRLTKLKMFYDGWRSMEFRVSRSISTAVNRFSRDEDVTISFDLHDSMARLGGKDAVKSEIRCIRYAYEAEYDRAACQSRYGQDTALGKERPKSMLLQVVIPYPEYVAEVGTGTLYSFFPTRLRLPVPMVCHVPFKLDPPREFVETQNNSRWFMLSCTYLSQLLDYAYTDWCRTVKADIVRYLPSISESMFCKNDGKERCLAEQEQFLGRHFAELPLFYTASGNYKPAADTVMFNTSEGIKEPVQVYSFLKCKKELFLPPDNVKMPYLGFQVLRDVHLSLFRIAMTNATQPTEILNYLDSVDYRYEENVILNWDKFTLTSGQIEEIFRHKDVARAFQAAAQFYLKKNQRPNFSVADGELISVEQLFCGSFDLNDAPNPIEKYLRYCEGHCLLLEIGERQCLPCYNVLVLAKSKPRNSFIGLCDLTDPGNDFTIRWRLRELSENLSEIEDDISISDRDYLKKLRSVRVNIKEALTTRGYNRYIDLIMRSGSDRGRFLQELLQNADDLEYLADVKPSFCVSLQDAFLVTQSNEVGFKRKNVRAITAIGESTKNQILSNATSIGEKGVGFKSVFAVSSDVKIFSGAFKFLLSAEEPTIPKLLDQASEKTAGTRMEIHLKSKNLFPNYSEKEILEMCLCLRKLRVIEIGPHHVRIDDEDTDTMRIITIDKRRHTFKKYTHCFTVRDEKALLERANGTRSVSPMQSIVCYVPEKTEFPEYCLYVGLPTKHKIKIPLVIDAPFDLTTSREEIDTGNNLWNDLVRKEMYTAILNVMESLKAEERGKVFRFSKFVRRFQGTAAAYLNDISDCGYLTSFDFLGMLRKAEILPTFDTSTFVAPQEKRARRFPDALIMLFIKGEFGETAPDTAIDLSSSDFDSVLNALGCEAAGFDNTFPVIEQYAEANISDSAFREKLYEYLQTVSSGHYERIQQLAIIPVYAKASGAVEYISWEEGSVFVKKDAEVSAPSYYVLNEKLLSKSICENIFGVNINEMNSEWERNRYNDQLRALIRGSNTAEIYRYLLSEYSKGAFKRYGSQEMLVGMKELIPLKNQMGEITDTGLFVCDQPEGYFPVDAIRRITVHRECAKLAEYLRCENLCDIHYEDIDYYAQLSADDVETLIDEYFRNKAEIIRGFYADGLLSDELIDKYDLWYMIIGGRPNGDIPPFPDDPIKNINQLREHLQKKLKNPTRIVKRKVERMVDKGQGVNGEEFNLDGAETRMATLVKYSPDQDPEMRMGFCQMCHEYKSFPVLEVNNIEPTPKFFFEEMRVVLCLECSKYFESIRSHADIQEVFLKKIREKRVFGEGKADIPIGEKTITFTATHLAEIQEILKNYPK